MRRARYAGSFYPDDPYMLSGQLTEFFKGVEESDAIGAIVPHAGYMYSGAVAAKAYASLRKYKRFLVLGFSHMGIGRHALSISGQDWETPLGVLKKDQDMIKRLERVEGAGIDDSAHENEHSIEVQMPFIKYISPDALVTAISVMDSGIEVDIPKDVCVIASSDFTHYGRDFGYVPFDSDIKKSLEKLDMGAVDCILKGDSSAFNEYIEKTGATICGRAPISLLMGMMHGAKARMVEYRTSGEITGDYGHCVSYVSILFS